MKITFERPQVTDFGPISAHTFMPTPPNSQGRGGGGHKGFRNRVETTNCEPRTPRTAAAGPRARGTARTGAFRLSGCGGRFAGLYHV